MNDFRTTRPTRPTRRRLLQSAGASALSGLTPGWLRAADAVAVDSGAAEKDDDRILVIVELSGGNDGLNTVVPYGDDAYYRHRPHIGIRPDEVLKLDDHYGFNPGMLGFERLWNSGDLAIVHGCGYDNPSYSHFTSMAYWHTAAPNGGDEFGWVGRLADVLQPDATPNFLINIDSRQSLAVKSRLHSPVVFDDPAGHSEPAAQGGSRGQQDIASFQAEKALEARRALEGGWAGIPACPGRDLEPEALQ